MHRHAVDEEPELVGRPPLDEQGLPTRRFPPMTYDQALPALWLARSLEHHRDRHQLLWHIQYDDPVDYEDGEGQRQRLFPDVYVVCGMGQRPGGPLRVWLRPQQVPSVVFELAVASSLERDRGEKLETARRLGVAEYFVFDVNQVKIPGALEGHRLHAGDYLPIPRVPTPSGEARLHSERLDLDLQVVPDPSVPGGLTLRAFLPGGSEPIPTPEVAEKEAALREEGREQAASLREEGREDGLQDGLQRAILGVLEARFGEVPEPLAKKTSTIQDPSALEGLARRAATVASIDAFERGLPTPE